MEYLCQGMRKSSKFFTLVAPIALVLWSCNPFSPTTEPDKTPEDTTKAIVDTTMVKTTDTTATKTDTTVTKSDTTTAKPDSILVPVDATCAERLASVNVAFEVSPATTGVALPITVKLPILGMNFRSYGSKTSLTSLFMDCNMAEAFIKALPILKKHKVTAFLTMGLYEYRCINGNGTAPDNCVEGISNHAFGKAIDVGGFLFEDGSTVDVLKDFVKSTGGTCAAVPANAKDSVLHALACEMFNAKVWQTVLTPNYNSIHYNHFHMDINSGKGFMGKVSAISSSDVDEGEDRH